MTLQDCEPTAGVTGLLDLFERFTLVALGEMHGVEQGADFVLEVVRHPLFAERVNAIVVEFGNAFHQQVADAYVAGADVPMSAVRRIWHDFAGAAGPWGARMPIYEQFFSSIRGLNESLPADQRIRVLLGDPPVDWSAIRTREDARTIRGGRDEHFASVVERLVLERGQRALLLAGIHHLFRVRSLDVAPRPGLDPPAHRNITQLLEDGHPGSTYVVMPHPGEPDVEKLAELEARLASWPIPSLAAVRNSWLDELSAATMFGGGNTRLFWPDGKLTKPFAGSSATLGDLIDAYLYLGPAAAYTWSKPSLTPVDEEDRAEVERRAALLGQPLA
jgi:hypothetical protein